MANPNWASGYVSDIAYTLGFYREMAPTLIDYALALNGQPGVGQSGLNYCELGCGRGYGTALLAAANPDCTFVGIDFNPAHIGEARALAQKAGLTNLTFLEASFADAARMTDGVPDAFEIVALHGVYSWVSAEVREDIHEFLRKRLVPGGVAYVSYNTYPGWSAQAPLREMLKAVADRSTGDTLKRVNAGRAVLTKLAQAQSGFVASNPGAKRRVEVMGSQDPAYIAHEFLNRDWHPLYVTQAMADLSEAKLSYVASATIGENRLNLSVPADLMDTVQSAPDVAMRELLRDYAINKQFRRDIYVKGASQLGAADARKRYDGLTLMLLDRPDPAPEEWQIPAGTARVKPEVLDSILAALSAGPTTLGEVRAKAVAAGTADADVPAVLDILVHNGVVLPARSDHATLDRKPAHRLNQVLAELAGKDDTHRFLAAPVLGSAVGVSHFDRIVAPKLAQDEASDDVTHAKAVYEILESSGKRIMRDGKPVDDPTTAVSELTGVVAGSRRQGLQRLRALGAVS